MSDSDSSISSNYVSSKSKLPFPTRKRPLTNLQSDDSSDSGSSNDAAFTFSKHRFSTSIHNSEHKQEAKSESDSEDSVLKNMRGYKTAARFSKKSHELYQDSDSDNDLEVQAVTNKTLVVNKENDNVASRNNRTVMIDSDDSDNDLDKLKILESEAMKKARLAREALSAAPMGFIDIQDDEHTGDENYIDTNAATGLKMAEIQPLRHQMLPKGPIIKIKFRANIQSAPTNHVGRTMHSKSITLPFPSNTNVEQVMNSYREKVNATITPHAKVVFMLDGLPMKMDKTLQDYDLEDEDLVDVLIDIPLTAQIQPPRHQMLPKGPIIKIKFRANIQSAPTNHVGRTMHSKSITLPFPSNTNVEQVMNSYREKVNATITPHAKVVFMLDGLPMKMDKTLQDYDLEDEDLVDVLIDIPLTAQIQPPRHQMLPKGPIIKIKFRANIQSAPTNHVGRTMHSKSITLPFPSNTKVEQVMNSYREKVNATITSHAKVVFMLDGLPMKTDKTLQDYDLEDEDLVDVLINILP